MLTISRTTWRLQRTQITWMFLCGSATWRRTCGFWRIRCPFHLCHHGKPQRWGDCKYPRKRGKMEEVIDQYSRILMDLKGCYISILGACYTTEFPSMLQGEHSAHGFGYLLTRGWAKDSQQVAMLRQFLGKKQRNLHHEMTVVSVWTPAWLYNSVSSRSWKSRSTSVVEA